MSPVILATKLYLPPSRPNWVIRARLMQRLNDGLRRGCKLALVSAPAGFGKTTLVIEWVNSLKNDSAKPQVAWLSLNSSDNDLPGFIAYLAAALQTCAPGVGQTTLSLLEVKPLPPAEELLAPLLNDIAAQPQALMLVLDDYHTIQQPVIHQAMAFFIERQPPNIHTVITARFDPLLPLSRWRARGLLTDIRLKDLRFNDQEAGQFFTDTMELRLQPEEVSALANRTEGWIAGLQLAAVSLLQSDEGDRDGTRSLFVQDFAGDNRYVMDYLIDEVLCRQPEEVQRFLLRTSFLQRFNAHLCSVMLDDDSAAASPAEILAYLDQANLFLIPLDQHREWFRYHHLFAELLQYRLQLTEGKETLAELKRRASIWFEENNFSDEAIQYALSYAQISADWDLYSQLINRHGMALITQGEVTQLLRLLSCLPDAAIRSNPGLCHFYGYTLTNTGKLDAGAEYLALAEEGFKDQPERLAMVLVHVSYNACFQGDFKGEIALSRRALSLLSLDNQSVRGMAAVSLGLGLSHTGNPRGCESAMREAFSAGQQSNNPRTCVHALTYLGRMAVLRLDFKQAEYYFQLGSQYQVNGKPFPSCDMPTFDLAQLKYEQNDLPAARALVEQGFEMNQRSGSIEMRAYGYRIRARLNQLDGLPEAAQADLDQALHLAFENNLSPLTLSLNAACQVEMALTDGSLREAAQAAPEIVKSRGYFPFLTFPETSHAHLLLVQNQRDKALQLINPLLPQVEQDDWEFPRAQVRLLQAWAETNPEKARQYLREALNLAEQSRAARCFLDLGAPIQALLLALRPQIKPAESRFADQLLAAFKSSLAVEIHNTPDSAQMPPPGGLVEPLSPREIEVLRLLADGLSNAEIAARLYLSPNTLKAHTQNIYSKMDVHSRIQVVKKGRDLGLIE